MPCALRVSIADHLADADDDRRHRRGIGDEQRPEVLVPAIDEQDHEQCGNVCPRQRDDHVDQETPGAGAVDLGCLDEFVGDRQKELAEQQCRRRGSDQRENQAGIGVDQTEIGSDLCRSE